MSVTLTQATKQVYQVNAARSSEQLLDEIRKHLKKRPKAKSQINTAASKALTAILRRKLGSNETRELRRFLKKNPLLQLSKAAQNQLAKKAPELYAEGFRQLLETTFTGRSELNWKNFSAPALRQMTSRQRKLLQQEVGPLLGFKVPRKEAKQEEADDEEVAEKPARGKSGSVDLADFKPPGAAKYSKNPLKAEKPRSYDGYSATVLHTKIPNQTGGPRFQTIDINWLVLAYPNFTDPKRKYKVSKLIWASTSKAFNAARREPEKLQLVAHRKGGKLPRPREKRKFIIREDDHRLVREYIRTGGQKPRFK